MNEKSVTLLKKTKKKPTSVLYPSLNFIEVNIETTRFNLLIN